MVVVADEDEIERAVFEPSDWSKPCARARAQRARRFWPADRADSTSAAQPRSGRVIALLPVSRVG